MTTIFDKLFSLSNLKNARILPAAQSITSAETIKNWAAYVIKVSKAFTKLPSFLRVNVITATAEINSPGYQQLAAVLAHLNMLPPDKQLQFIEAFKSRAALVVGTIRYIVEQSTWSSDELPIDPPDPKILPNSPDSKTGVDWILRTSAANNAWCSVTHGNGLFVAVASTGHGNRVMTSLDGITWTIRTSASDHKWSSVAYGNGLFVAVSTTTSTPGNRIMTSPDGINWTIQTTAANNVWNSVVYGNGLFVAVASNGTGNRVMTSPDGITWTSQASAANNSWRSVAYGNGLFVAVASSGTGNRVMTSPDGITWTSQASAADNEWFSVAYGNGLFVAVARTGANDRVMTSPDGITWTTRTSANNNYWNSVTYGNGLFAAVARTGTGNRVMTSPDGITWTIQTNALSGPSSGVLHGGPSISPSGGFPESGPYANGLSADNDWLSVTYGNGRFVAVSQTGYDNRVMTSGTLLD